MKLVHKKILVDESLVLQKSLFLNLYASKSNQKWMVNPLAYIVLINVFLWRIWENIANLYQWHIQALYLCKNRDYEVDLKECSSNTCIIKEALLGLKRRRWSPSEAISARDRRADDIWSIPAKTPLLWFTCHTEPLIFARYISLSL